MDDFTTEHLAAWLNSNVPDKGKREELGKLIGSFVDEHPSVIERGDSWPEIQALAERNRDVFN